MTPFRIAWRRVRTALMAAIAASSLLLSPAGSAASTPSACVLAAVPTIANLPTATNARIMVVQAPEVRERYNLPEWMDESWTLIIHEGDMLVDRHLLMDAPHSRIMDETLAIHWSNLFGRVPCDQPLAIVVDGNLKVNGSILNASPADSTALIVTGQTRANSLLANGSYLAFGGPAEFSEAVYGNGPHGEVLFAGPVNTPLLINSGHKLEMRDKSGISGIGTYFNSLDPEQKERTEESNPQENRNRATEYAHLPPDISAVVRPQLKSFSAIQRALLNGRPVLKQDHQGQ